MVNIWGILMVNVTIYSSIMDSMGYINYLYIYIYILSMVEFPTSIVNDNLLDS